MSREARTLSSLIAATAVSIAGTTCPTWGQVDPPAATARKVMEEIVVGGVGRADTPDGGADKAAPEEDVREIDLLKNSTDAELAPSEERGTGTAKTGAPAPRADVLNLGLEGILPLTSGRKEEPADGADASGDENQGRIKALTQEAVRDFERQRVADTVRRINELIAIKPYDASFHFALGLCHRKQKDFKEALKKYQDVVDLGGPKALISLLKAEVFASEGKKSKVFEMLREAAVGGRNIITDVHKLPPLKEFQSDTEFIKLALQLERVEVKKGRRFDPFTNPFPTPDKQGKKSEDAAKAAVKEELGPAAQEKLVRDAKNLYERVQLFIKLQDEERAMSAYNELRGMEEKQQLVSIPKLANEFHLIASRLREVETLISGIRLKYYYNQAKAKLEKVREFFEKGEYATVEKLHGELEQLTREMVTVNSNYSPISEQILQLSEAWLRRARVRLTFEARKPSIQGVVISGDVRLAILNDRVVKQGEQLDEFRVVKVDNNKVTFRYKGEEIPLVFRRY